MTSDRTGRRRAAWRWEAAAAATLALARGCLALALFAGLLASYAWWGSPQSPLRALVPVAVAAAIGWLMMSAAHKFAVAGRRNARRR